MISKWNYLPLTSEEQDLEIELAKKYGTDDSGRFVNGILGSLSK